MNPLISETLSKFDCGDDGDLQFVLEFVKNPDSEKVAQLLSIFKSAEGSRLAYLEILPLLASGDLLAAANRAIDHFNAGHNKYSAYNLGLMYRLINEMGGDASLLNLAHATFNAAFVEDNSYQKACDALRDIHKDKYDFANKLLGALGHRPRLVLEPTTSCHLACRGCTRTIENTPSGPRRTGSYVLHRMLAGCGAWMSRSGPLT